MMIAHHIGAIEMAQAQLRQQRSWTRWDRFGRSCRVRAECSRYLVVVPGTADEHGAPVQIQVLKQQMELHRSTAER